MMRLRGFTNMLLKNQSNPIQLFSSMTDNISNINNLWALDSPAIGHM